MKPTTFDVIAIGNALVDTEFQLSETILHTTALTKGNMTLADAANQRALFDTLNTQNISPAKRSGGGSAANSMVAFAALGGQPFYCCQVGDDSLGQFYLDDLHAVGVYTDANNAITTGTTGTCAVLVTPDGERTMQTHLGVSGELSARNVNFDKVAHASYLYLEGYLAMSPTILPAIEQLIATAKQHDTKIAVSFADPAVIKFAKEGVQSWLSQGVDVVFCNLEEAQLFANTQDTDAMLKTLLAYTHIAVITNGDKPVMVGTKQQTHIIDVPSAKAVIDTNGAGDNFAGAFLYGLHQSLPIETCVALAGTVASQVVGQFGARLSTSDYAHAKAQFLGVP